MHHHVLAQNTKLVQWQRNCRGSSGRPGQGVSWVADPLKFGAEVRHCIWRLCRTGVKGVLYGNDCPLIALTVSTISRGEVKNNVSCYMIKLDFWPRPVCWKKMVPARLVNCASVDVF